MYPREKDRIMTRKQARENAFLLLFERKSNPTESAEQVLSCAEEARETETDAYVLDIYQGAEKNAEEIAAVIASHLIGWKAARLSAVSIAVLTLAAYEILYRDDVPDRVSINEAIELSKKYDDEKAYALVNGVLNAIVKDKEAAGTASSSAAGDGND